MKICFEDVVLELRHLRDLKFCFDVLSPRYCVSTHHFNYDKEHFRSRILFVESVGSYEGS